MNKSIVFFDYDGTLVDESEKIYRPTEATLNSIKKLKENGHLAVLATGRAKCYVPQTGIDWDGYITSNGAHAELNGVSVFDKLVPDELVKKLVDKSKEYGYMYVLENQDECYTNGFDNEHFIDTLNFFDIPREHFKRVSEAEKIKAYKMFLTFDNMESFEAIKREFEGEFIMGKHRTNMSCDVDIAGNNKGMSIGKIADAAGVDIKDTYAFGDSINDFEMMKSVGTGIAMGSHIEGLEKLCEFVTETVKNEGITKGLERVGLI